MIRFILVCIVVIGFLILSIPILLVEWIIGKFAPMAKDISSLRIVQFMFRFILWITGAKVTVIGEENVPKDTPVLYIGNHRSYFDILLTYSRCPIRTGYIAKKEMEKIPLLSNWMRYLHCLFLDRKDIKQGLKTILAAVDKVKSGISICIFPEGTRNKNEDEASRSQPKRNVLSFLWRSAIPLMFSKLISQPFILRRLWWNTGNLFIRTS